MRPAPAWLGDLLKSDIRHPKSSLVDVINRFEFPDGARLLRNAFPMAARLARLKGWGAGKEVRRGDPARSRRLFRVEADALGVLSDSPRSLVAVSGRYLAGGLRSGDE